MYDKSLTHDALHNRPSSSGGGKFAALGKIKEEWESKKGCGPSESSDASKSKSLTQDHNYSELLSESVDPAEQGAFRKLSLMYTGVSLARDAIDPSKSNMKSTRNAMDLRGYDVHELKRFHTLMLTALNHVKNMAQAAPNASTDPSKMLKHVPDVVRSLVEMRQFSRIIRYEFFHVFLPFRGT